MLVAAHKVVMNKVMTAVMVIKVRGSCGEQGSGGGVGGSEKKKKQKKVLMMVVLLLLFSRF